MLADTTFRIPVRLPTFCQADTGHRRWVWTDAPKKYKSIEKHTFGSAELPQILKESIGEETAEITLIGLCTDICVVSNALLIKAALTETEIYVDSACCAGVTPASHKAALDTMRSCQINIL